MCKVYNISSTVWYIPYFTYNKNNIEKKHKNNCWIDMMYVILLIWSLLRRELKNNCNHDRFQICTISSIG